VLHSCDTVLSTAADVNLVPRLIATITSNMCKEHLTSELSKLDQCMQLKPVTVFANVTP
jgi:hypothetical protein